MTRPLPPVAARLYIRRMVTNARDAVRNRSSVSPHADLEPRLRAAIERWESRPHNRPLSDKTWVEELLHDARRHFASAVRAR